MQPVLHVERDDRGRGVRHPADHARDLVRGAVVQQPAEQRREAAPGQDRGDLGAGRFRLVTNQIGCAPGQPAVGAVHELQGDAAVRQPGGAQPFGLLAVEDEVDRADRGGAQALGVAQGG